MDTLPLPLSTSARNRSLNPESAASALRVMPRLARQARGHPGELGRLAVDDELAGRAQAFQLSRFQERHARRIISPVFQPFEGFHQAGRRRLIAENTDDAAH